jgi:UDP-glucose 4-epimerase
MWLGPLTPYAASKLAAEGYVEAYGSAYGVPVSILRFFNVFGPNQRPDHEYAAVLPKWIWLALHNQPINVFGDGNTSRDFTYIETVLDVAISAMTEKIFTSGVVNLAYGNKISLNDVVSLLKKNFPDLKVQQMPPRSGDVRESQNNPSLVKELFPQVNPKPFEQAFQETLDWLRNFGDSVANGPETND